MKIVLDANIFISSIFWSGNPRVVLDRVIANLDELFITKEILDEIEAVIGRPKFHVGQEQINFIMKSIEEISNTVVIKNHKINKSRGKTDNKYLECAVNAKSDYIISGDNHLLEIKEYKKIKIITPKNYLEIVTG